MDIVLYDKEEVLNFVLSHGLILRYASEELQNDIHIVLDAVSQNGLALQYVSEELCDDKEVVLAAVSQNGFALQYASEDLRDDKEVVLTAVSQNGYAMQYVSEDLRDDKEVVLASMFDRGLVFRYASDELRGDIDVAIAAVTKEGDALQYASEELLKNREVVLAAVKKDGHALYYAPYFHNDREISIHAAKSHPMVIFTCSSKLKNDADIVAQCLEIAPRLIEYVNPKLLYNPNVAIAILKATKDPKYILTKEYRNVSFIRNLFKLELKYEIWEINQYKKILKLQLYSSIIDDMLLLI